MTEYCPVAGHHLPGKPVVDDLAWTLLSAFVENRSPIKRVVDIG